MSDTPETDEYEPKRGLFARLLHKNTQAEQQPEIEADDPDEHGSDELFHCSPACAGHRIEQVPPLLVAMKHTIIPGGTARPAPAVREWTPMFADEVTAGDLVGVPAGVFGMAARELKVCKIRKHEGQGDDPLAPWLTLLMVDTTSGDVFSPTVSAQQGFRVAPSVPDSPAFLGGGA